MLDEGKYIVFKREDFYTLMGTLALPPYFRVPGSRRVSKGDIAGADWDCNPISQYIEKMSEAAALPDAVVIRRQDLFAAPALDSYANSIALAAKLIPDVYERERLIELADYFHTQAQLASVEGMKVPD